ncbi:hypothetical protein F5Y15DRAFT_318466 [Xylariaceae sp. FL0016]|nr:hypothetical protein F5Y15DRAFT_318466 [Xylariaceae sp. FL0016]
MSKRTTFTTISPLPPGIPRNVVLNFLHNHEEMIDLNPLIIERHPIPAPPHAPAEEQRCIWWSMTDKISYLPGGVVSSDITYTAAFNDLPTGIQTHVYAPMGTDIRERWSLCGNLPGEPLEPVELGLGAPRQGLYLREDVELRCNFVMSTFVKKTLKKAHGALVERLCQKAQLQSQSELNTDMSNIRAASFAESSNTTGHSRSQSMTERMNGSAHGSVKGSGEAQFMGPMDTTATHSGFPNRQQQQRQPPPPLQEHRRQYSDSAQQVQGHTHPDTLRPGTTLPSFSQRMTNGASGNGAPQIPMPETLAPGQGQGRGWLSDIYSGHPQRAELGSHQPAAAELE